jgi:hypothetical protein
LLKILTNKFNKKLIAMIFKNKKSYKNNFLSMINIKQNLLINNMIVINNKIKKKVQIKKV